MSFDRSLVMLIVNPAAGRASLLERRLPAIERLLEQHDLSMRVVFTTPESDSAEQLSRSASEQAGMVIACGGDGTVHGVLQALVHSETTLGVLPLGTANALSRHLKLPLDPVAAMERLLAARPTRIPVGKIETSSTSRYFLVMAGCGPDAALVHSLGSESAKRAKRRFGRASYYVSAGWLFMTRGWPAFQVEYRLGEIWHETRACAALASRLPDLGGLFTGITRRAQFLAPTLHLHVMTPPAHLSLLAWFTLSRFGVRHALHRAIDVEEFRCSALGSSRSYVQADAELLGLLPFSARVVPDALTLLM